MQGTAPIDWTGLALGALAGLALFLFGVHILSESLRRVQGGRFERLLRRSAGGRVSGLATGAAATVALDSSSVTIILVVAIVDAGLLPFAAALPVILGANIGTTFSSQIFAWEMDRWSPLLIAGGLTWGALAKSDNGRGWSRVVLGLGLVLFGLHEVGQAAEPLQGQPRIADWLARLETPALGVLAGAAATVAIQSSSAMMGILITLAGGGLVSLPAAVAIMLGAEVGTCADTLVATIGRSRAAVRAGVFHLLFNVAAVTVGVLLIDRLAAAAAMTAGSTGQRIANAHLLFNVAGALAALPVIGLAARTLARLIPDAPPDTGRPAGRPVHGEG